MKKHLCVVADDFGMHEAVNEGIVKTFVDGLLTDTNIMPPAPCFDEAVKLAHAHQIPIGLHATYTSEWDNYRWGPLTGGKSLTGPDGNFHVKVEDAWRDIDEEEALAEITAQYEKLTYSGIKVVHIGQHMGFDKGGKFLRVMDSLIRLTGHPYKGCAGEPYRKSELTFNYDWNSVIYTSSIGDIEKAEKYLRQRLAELTPGYHMWVTHPATDHESLDKMCSPDCPYRNWARKNRITDTALLLSPEIRDLLEELDIILTPMSECPVWQKPQ